MSGHSQVRDVSRGAGNLVRVTALVTDFRARHRLLRLTKAFSQHDAASTGGTSRFCAAQQSASLANWCLVYIIAKLTKLPALAACSRACREKETEVDNDLRIQFQSAPRTHPRPVARLQTHICSERSDGVAVSFLMDDIK